MNPSKLPRKPSKLIRIALEDLIKAEKSPLYNINMNVWHGKATKSPGYGMGMYSYDKGFEENKCSVCLAGSVMAFSLKTNIDLHITNSKVSEFEDVSDQLEALDELRVGRIDQAMYSLHGSNKAVLMNPESELFNRVIIKYETNPAVFKRQMNRLANDLEMFGY